MSVQVTQPLQQALKTEKRNATMWVSVYTAAHKLPGGAWLVVLPCFQTLHRAGRERKRFPESPTLQEAVLPTTNEMVGKKVTSLEAVWV